MFVAITLFKIFKYKVQKLLFSGSQTNLNKIPHVHCAVSMISGHTVPVTDNGGLLKCA